MRVFCHAQQFAGVNIDETVVCRSVDWLIQNQRADGSLPEVRSVQIRSYLTVRNTVQLFLYCCILRKFSLREALSDTINSNNFAAVNQFF